MGYTPHILVVGGGAVGTGIARDLALRGLDVTLVESGQLTSGASGRMLGVLYSGARVANSDPDTAVQYRREQQILRKIAAHCIEETDGLLLDFEHSDSSVFDQQLDACRDCEIPTTVLEGDEARELEPSLAGEVERAIRVPEATVDPFRLTVANAQSAREHGTEIRLHTEVTDIRRDDGAIVGVEVTYNPPHRQPDEDSDPDDEQQSDIDEPETGEDGAQAETDADADDEDEESEDESEADGDESENPAHSPPSSLNPSFPDTIAEEATRDKVLPGSGSTGAEQPREQTVEEVDADYVVNTTGSWVAQLAEMADIDIPVSHSKGAMVVADLPEIETVLTRCGDGPTATSIVPHGKRFLLGATDEQIDGPDEFTEEQREIDQIIDDLAEVVPEVSRARTLRSYWGVRSQYGNSESEIAANSGFELLNHGERDDCWGMTSVVGGSVTSHRLIAERVADQVCLEFGIRRECQTADLALPGCDDETVLSDAMDDFDVQSPVSKSQREKQGRRKGKKAGSAKQAPGGKTAPGKTSGKSKTAKSPAAEQINPVICESESVTRREIQAALHDETATRTDLNDVRIRTWATMGECQGGRCAHRIAAELHPEHDTETVVRALENLYDERWKGQRHALWGEQLSQAMANYEFHATTLNRSNPPDESIDLSAFDDGSGSDGGPSVTQEGFQI